MSDAIITSARRREIMAAMRGMDRDALRYARDNYRRDIADLQRKLALMQSWESMARRVLAEHNKI